MEAVFFLDSFGDSESDRFTITNYGHILEYHCVKYSDIYSSRKYRSRVVSQQISTVLDTSYFGSYTAHLASMSTYLLYIYTNQL